MPGPYRSLNDHGPGYLRDSDEHGTAILSCQNLPDTPAKFKGPLQG